MAGNKPRIARGFAGQREAVAGLYWAHVLRPEMGRMISDRAGRALVRRGLQSGRVLVALAADGTVLGCAGLRGADGGALILPPARLRHIAGQPAAWALHLWRGGPVSGDLVLDGLAVAPFARRQGIARALLHAALHEAVAQSYPGLRVELRPSNHAALALYRAEGFAPITRARIGWGGKALILRRDA